MAAPQGGVAKLYFNAEPGDGSAGGYGSEASLTTVTGYRLYYDSFVDNTEKRPLDFQEISGVSVDYGSFFEGEIQAGFTLEYSMRFSPVHMILSALSMGDLAFSTGTAAPFTFFADLHDNLDSATFWHQVPVTNNTSFEEFTFYGTKVARSVWSHRAGEPMKHRIEATCSHHDHNVTEITSVPPVGVGRTPDENLVNWFCRTTAQFTIDRLGTVAPVNLNVRSWELTLDNKIGPYYLIQDSRKSAEPSREDFREITFRMEIEQDAAWSELVQVYGPLISSNPLFTGVALTYDDPASTNDLSFSIGNVIFNNVPKAITSPGRLLQTVSGRAHRITGGVPQDSPLRMTWNVPFKKPADAGTPTVDYGQVITP
jgi:hypothetical protein